MVMLRSAVVASKLGDHGHKFHSEAQFSKWTDCLKEGAKTVSVKTLLDRSLQEIEIVVNYETKSLALVGQKR